MAPKQRKSPLIVIVGPTGSGKSALALEIARINNGEIICADSRTVYKGMDIGTAKPTKAEQKQVPHHLLDIIEPNRIFTAAEFKRQASQVMDGCEKRGTLPVMVGGTGLYIDGVIFDFAFLPPASNEERGQLQALTVPELQQKISDLGLRLPENSQNPRHLIRVIETNGAVPIKKGLRDNTLVIGVDMPKEDLIKRINKRIEDMFINGLEEEVKALSDTYGWDSLGLSAVGYQEWQQYFKGNISQQQVQDTILKNTINYAKRQRTWNKRNPYVVWVQNSSEALELSHNFLYKNSLK